MTTTALPATHESRQLSASVRVDRHDSVALVVLTREAKRNALDDATVQALGSFFAAPPEWTRAAVLAADGPHFSAGLDLAELVTRTTIEGVEHSMMWHRAFESVASGKVPVVAALHGAVIGGGLELALATHVRVADSTAFYSLPEGQHGLFVGGGGSVRLPRVIGTAGMTDLMLTGRRLHAAEGHQAGITQYLVPEGEARSRALELAQRISGNADITNFAVLHALPRIAEADPAQGYLLESLMAAVASGSDDAKERIRTFLDGRARG